MREKKKENRSNSFKKRILGIILCLLGLVILGFTTNRIYFLSNFGIELEVLYIGPLTFILFFGVILIIYGLLLIKFVVITPRILGFFYIMIGICVSAAFITMEILYHNFSRDNFIFFIVLIYSSIFFIFPSIKKLKKGANNKITTKECRELSDYIL